MGLERNVFLICSLLVIYAAAQAKEGILEQVKEASRNNDVSPINSNLHM